MLQRRSFRRSWGLLALLALWLQFALSFGHIHSADIYPYGHPVGSGHGLVQVTADALGTLPDPARPAQNDTDTVCAICASMALVSSLVLPDPVGLPPPPAAFATLIASPASFLLPSAPFLLFQTRAPPRA